ncbi:hypothetical protein ES703_102907 [subsurface metagenome]
MPLLGGANEVVVGDVQPPPQLLEAYHILVAVGLGIGAPGLGRLLHLQAVLVRAGQEVHLVAQRAVIAGQHVRQDGRVGVTDVRQVVHVVDWRSNVELGHGSASI